MFCHTLQPALIDMIDYHLRIPYIDNFPPSDFIDLQIRIFQRLLQGEPVQPVPFHPFHIPYGPASYGHGLLDRKSRRLIWHVPMVAPIKPVNSTCMANSSASWVCLRNGVHIPLYPWNGHLYMEHDDWPAHFSPKVGRTSIQQSHQVGQNHNVTQAQQKLYMIDTRSQGRSRKCWFLLNWCKVCWKRILVPWLKKQAHSLSKLWRRERRRTRITRRMQMKEVREDRKDRDVRPEPGLSSTMSWHGVCPALPGWKMSEWSSRAIENPQDPESLHCVQALSSCDPSHEVDRS